MHKNVLNQFSQAKGKNENKSKLEEESCFSSFGPRSGLGRRIFRRPARILCPTFGPRKAQKQRDRVPNQRGPWIIF